MKKLWPYLILNVLVSAVTVTVVLIIWNSTHPCVASVASNAAWSGPSAEPTATLPVGYKNLLKLDTVIGAGDLENEHLTLRYSGNEPLDLNKWTLWAGKKQVYTFPSVLLFKGGALSLYSKGGTNTAIELYMGSTGAFWSSGMVLSLRDAHGNTWLEYTIP